MEPRDQFAANLRQLREKAGMTQERLGHLAGVHPTEVSRMEAGMRDPRLTTVLKLAGALGTETDMLLSGLKPIPPSEQRPDNPN